MMFSLVLFQLNFKQNEIKSTFETEHTNNSNNSEKGFIDVKFVTKENI